MDEVLSPEKRALLAARLVLLAPPCEYDDVLNDVRCIVGDDPLVQKKLALSTSQYNKDQMVSVNLPDSEYRTLITSHGDLGNSYFMCPRAGVSFYFDHFKHSVSDIKPIEDNEANDLKLWRRSLEDYATVYVNEHFLNGALSVYLTKSPEGHQIILCIQADFCKNVSTGRWRSEWTAKVNNDSLNKEFTVRGIVKVQTHLYEEGNVQLVSSKESNFVLTASKPCEFAEQCMKRIKEIDCAYQLAIGENFKTMSDTTFKALRRQLPLTRSKIDWNNIITYQIGSELTRGPS